MKIGRRELFKWLGIAPIAGAIAALPRHEKGIVGLAHLEGVDVQVVGLPYDFRVQDYVDEYNDLLGVPPKVIR